MKRALILIAVLALAGCGETEPGSVGGTTEVIRVDVDGRKVTCIVWDGHNAGGVSCDWNPKQG